MFCFHLVVGLRLCVIYLKRLINVFFLKKNNSFGHKIDDFFFWTLEKNCRWSFVSLTAANINSYNQCFIHNLQVNINTKNFFDTSFYNESKNKKNYVHVLITIQPESTKISTKVYFTIRRARRIVFIIKAFE